MRLSSLHERTRLRSILSLTWGDWLDLATATVELGRARLTLRRASVQTMLETAIDTPQDARAYHPHVTIDRVGIAIARACCRVPWRADCLIQALAAQRWLRRHGIPSRVAIGIRESGADPFEAHAWLISGDTVVTGGDVSDYQPLRPRG